MDQILKIPNFAEIKKTKTKLEQRHRIGDFEVCRGSIFGPNLHRSGENSPSTKKGDPLSEECRSLSEIKFLEIFSLIEYLMGLRVS